MWPFKSKQVKPLPLETSRELEQKLQAVVEKLTSPPPPPTMEQEVIDAYIEHWITLLPGRLEDAIRSKEANVFLFATSTSLALPNLRINKFIIVAEEFIERFYATFGIKPIRGSDYVAIKTKALIKAFKKPNKPSEDQQEPKLHQQGAYR
jgi:hypothetical protein